MSFLIEDDKLPEDIIKSWINLTTVLKQDLIVNLQRAKNIQELKQNLIQVKVSFCNGKKKILVALACR